MELEKVWGEPPEERVDFQKGLWSLQVLLLVPFQDFGEGKVAEGEIRQLRVCLLDETANKEEEKEKESLKLQK